MSKKVRLIVVQGPNQLLYVLPVLRSQQELGEYKDCEDILLMGGYIEDRNMTEVCLQISQIWDFKERIILHGFETLCLDNRLDFDGAAELLKRIVNHRSVDVVYTVRNWHFINEIFFYTYPDALKICYGELGILDISSEARTKYFGVRPFNPSGQFLNVDEAHLLLVPINIDNAFDKCTVKTVDPSFFKSVVFEAAKQINNLETYCSQINHDFNSSVTFLLTTYETEAGYTRNLDDEIECYLSLALKYTQPGETIIIKGHPRQRFQQSEILARRLREYGRNAQTMPDNFNRTLIELFVPFLSIKKVIAPMSTSCTSLAYLSDCELVTGLGEDLTKQYLAPIHHQTRLFLDYLRVLTSLKARKRDFQELNYSTLEESFNKNKQKMVSGLSHQYPQDLLVLGDNQYVIISESEIKLREILTLKIPQDKFIGKPDFINEVFSLLEQQNEHLGESQYLKSLRAVRKKVTEFWLSLPEELLKAVYESNISRVYRPLLEYEIYNLPPSEDEQNLYNTIITYLAKGLNNQGQAIHYALALLLYYPPQRLSLDYGILEQIPEWLISNFLGLIFREPHFFQEIGDVESYCRYLEGWVTYIHDQIMTNPTSSKWQKVGRYFTMKAKFLPFMFSNIDLKDLYIKRAKIIELDLQKQGYEIDYSFPDREARKTKINIGILARSFTSKTETLATLPIYKYLNRDLFNIILFAVYTTNDRLDRYCAGYADALVQLPSNLAEQVQLIRETNLDILFISTNITAVTNQITLLASHRLARIQIVDANSPVTTGMSHIDYYISSQLSEAMPDAQKHYREKLITLISPPQCFDFATEASSIPSINVSREALGIAHDTIVYISGANYYKIIPEIEDTWIRIIAQVPNSVLVLYPFNKNWSPSYPVVAFTKRITATLNKYGLNENRVIILEPVASRADVKERLKLADIYLDSYPYSGMTSLIDPLEVGLPTVVLEGQYSRSRKGASLLRELQVFDLIANDENSYIQLAVTLGLNSQLRQEKSLQIQQAITHHPRFIDSKSYGAEIESLFFNLIKRYEEEFLITHLQLKSINLIIFPDWTQPEEILYEDLTAALRDVMAHSQQEQITLLIDIRDIDEEAANFLVSDITMNLLMEEEYELREDLQISWIQEVNPIQKAILLSHIQSRVPLKHENNLAISEWEARNWPTLSPSL